MLKFWKHWNKQEKSTTRKKMVTFLVTVPYYHFVMGNVLSWIISQRLRILLLFLLNTGYSCMHIISSGRVTVMYNWKYRSKEKRTRISVAARVPLQQSQLHSFFNSIEKYINKRLKQHAKLNIEYIQQNGVKNVCIKTHCGDYCVVVITVWY